MNDRATKAILLAALVTVIAGCGGAAQSYEDARFVQPEPEDPAALEDEQREAERALSDELARTEPRCEVACDLAERICDLSERICGIRERHPDDPELAARCRDGSARCESARARVAERCPCE
ncbi:MAG TPA: hypothetical protein VIL20_00895 [Sandaracinaceae bacterium]